MSDPSRQHSAATVRRTRRDYSVAFKRKIVEETLVPGAFVPAVARRYEINDNLVFAWRKLYREGKLGARMLTEDLSLSEQVDLLPVQIVDARSGAEQGELPTAGCEIEIDAGKRRVRIRGLSMDRAERILRDCLR
ncbi:transposase [Ralstonia pseudosolanacearum]|uniref:IS66-like element accessory protein TnpA n=1 Tax=Ralstonia pseudosolanacearum TaxID=1310165 RepID=UPI0026FDDEE2|nr:transposase [Ralstonia pseudosolanacearum]MDO3615297.1 transposase [Ralstonia pseudosolanacearum]